MQNKDVAILHASFTDFLGEEYRSHEFHVQPLNTVKYLDLLSCRLLSSLVNKISYHERREPWVEDPVDCILQLELWSINPWSFVDVLISISAKKPAPFSDELVCALINFNVYEYLNMLLDECVLFPFKFDNISLSLLLREYMNASHLVRKSISPSVASGAWDILASMVVFQNLQNNPHPASDFRSIG